MAIPDSDTVLNTLYLLPNLIFTKKSVRYYSIISQIKKMKLSEVR